ncbi:hypothetical protein PILCRDRAFT_6165 [Piloderma croceum F 1598]|uniref:Uncharacterized protein n=1 Tax=Piloderma croceum (strain F 1598) TaxID=765440 RepID=A0A0C3FXZ9_PILCF|nr:hypothetical protein PILCRDRAFT_6165 [Piloderma croceum F 1598]
MAHTTIEEQKEAYARELAAHTLRQWNAIRRSLDGGKSGEDASSSTSTTPDEYSHLGTDGNSKAQTPHNADGVETADYAHIQSNPGDRHGVTSLAVTR